VTDFKAIGFSALLAIVFEDGFVWKLFQKRPLTDLIL